MQIQRSGTPINLTSSGAISKCTGTILGFYVNSTTSGTIAILDGGSGGAAISGTITPAIGWNEFPAAITSSLGAYATIGSTINVTVFFAAGG